MKRQLTGGSQLYPGAHTPFTPQGGGKRGKDERENTTPSSGREECRKAGGSAKFRAGGEQPATDPRRAGQFRTCQKRQSGAREMYKVKLTSSALTGGAEK